MTALPYTTHRTKPRLIDTPTVHRHGYLNDAHYAHLKASCISDEIIRERGYRTILNDADLQHMAPSQRHVPAIGVPIHQLGNDEPYTIVPRPDQPRTIIKDDKEKPVKYEWQAGLSNCLDVLPRNRSGLTDASRDLWITEGVKKGDALASHDATIVPVAINGVWGWMEKDGKDADGNRYLHPDFRHFTLRGRRVVLAPDSDYQTNEQVQMAMHEAVKALRARGAIVGILKLPHLDDTKLGVDDAFAQGWTFDELQQAVDWPDGDPETRELIQLNEVERLKRKNVQLHQQIQWIYATLSNKDLTNGQRLTLLFTALEVRDQQNRQPHAGAVPARIWKIADESGQSTAAVGRHIKELQTCGVWQREDRKVHDTATGNVRTEVYLAPTPLIEQPRQIKPDIAKNGWGGKRETCTACGSDKLVSKTQVYCEGCGAVHKTSVRYVNAPTLQDDESEQIIEAADDYGLPEVIDVNDPPTLQDAESGKEDGEKDARVVSPLTIGQQIVESGPTLQDAESDLDAWHVELHGTAWRAVHPSGLATGTYTTIEAVQRAIKWADYQPLPGVSTA